MVTHRALYNLRNSLHYLIPSYQRFILLIDLNWLFLNNVVCIMQKNYSLLKWGDNELKVLEIVGISN